MFVTLQGGNYTANLHLFLAIYPLYDKENSEKFESQFQCFLKFSQTVGSTFNLLLQPSTYYIPLAHAGSARLHVGSAGVRARSEVVRVGFVRLRVGSSRLLVGSTRLFGYQHVGIGSVNHLLWVLYPT